MQVAKTPHEIIAEYELMYSLREFRKAFIPLEVIARNPKLYGVNSEPIHSQAKQEDFIDDPRKVVAAICGNRAGKTEAGCIKFLRKCNASKNPGRAWVLSESYDLQKTGAQEKILEYLKPEYIKHVEYMKGDSIKQIDYINPKGCLIKIEFKSYEQGVRKLQSAKLICVWMDEEPPEEVFDEVYTRTVDHGGQIILTFTPLKGLTWSYARIFAARFPHIMVYSWGMADNPCIPRVEIETLKATLTRKKANMRLYGKYEGSESQVWYAFERNIHLKPNLYDNQKPVDICIDWGVVVTAITFWQEKTTIQTDGTFKTVLNMVDAKEFSGYGYGQIITFCLQKGYQIQDWYCDPAGRARSQSSRFGKSLLTLIKEEYGIRFKYIPAQRIEEGIELVQSYLLNAKNETRLFIQEGIFLDNEQKATPEMRIEGYVRDEQGDPVKDGINDHLADSIRYYVTNKIRGKKGGVTQH